MKQLLETVNIPTKDININDLSIFYSVVEQYFNQNDWGYQLYKTFADDRWGEGTGARRLMRYTSLIRSMYNDGYKHDYVMTNTDVLMKMHSTLYQAGSSVDIYHNRVILSPDMSIVNGRHRVAVCIFMKEPTISCVINPDASKRQTIKYDDIFSEYENQLLVDCEYRLKNTLKLL